MFQDMLRVIRASSMMVQLLKLPVQAIHWSTLVLLFALVFKLLSDIIGLLRYRCRPLVGAV